MDAVVLDLVEGIISIVQQLVQPGEEAGQVVVPDPPPLGHAEHRLHEAHLCLETVDIVAQAGELGNPFLELAGDDLLGDDSCDPLRSAHQMRGGHRRYAHHR